MSIDFRTLVAQLQQQQQQQQQHQQHQQQQQKEPNWSNGPIRFILIKYY